MTVPMSEAEDSIGVKVNVKAPVATKLNNKQKRQVVFQDDDQRPKKLAHREQTADSILQKAKDLKKHRQSLPIYTGE